MANTKRVQVGRLALRVEGENWNAYYAQEGTMEGAIYLASIRMHLVENQEMKQAFMDLMRAVVGAIIENKTGIKPEWNDPKPAPEHEKSKS